METAGVGGGQAASGGNCPQFKGEVPPRRLAFCPQTLDALCLTLVMLEPRPQHPSGQLAPKYVGPKGQISSGLHSRAPCSHSPGCLLQQGPCCVPQRPRFQEPLVLGLVPASLSQPLGCTPGPPPHTRQNPGEQSWRAAPSTFLGPQRNQVGSWTTRMGGPGRGLGPVTWKAQASMRQEGLQACRCPRRPTRAGSSGHSASLEFTYSQSSHPSPPSPESPGRKLSPTHPGAQPAPPAGCLLGSEPRPGGWVGNIGPQQGLKSGQGCSCIFEHTCVLSRC